MTPREAAALVGAACEAEDLILRLIGARGGQATLDAHAGNVEAVEAWTRTAYEHLNALRADCEVGSPEALGYELVEGSVDNMVKTARLRRFILKTPRPAGKESG